MNPFLITTIVATCAGIVAFFLTLQGRRRAQRERTHNVQAKRNLANMTVDQRVEVIRSIRSSRRSVGDYKSGFLGRNMDEPVPSRHFEHPFNDYGLAYDSDVVHGSHHMHDDTSHDVGGGGSFDGGGSSDSYDSSSDSSSYDSGSSDGGSFSSND
jgi:hypothetical protein